VYVQEGYLLRSIRLPVSVLRGGGMGRREGRRDRKGKGGRDKGGTEKGRERRGGGRGVGRGGRRGGGRRGEGGGQRRRVQIKCAMCLLVDIAYGGGRVKISCQGT